MKNKVLLTGASGFIGGRIKDFISSDKLVIAGRRNVHSDCTFIKSDLDGSSDYSSVMGEIACVIHCAARVHVMHDETENPLDSYLKLNFDGTLNLAKQAAANGVKRFIYISTIKVNGESTVNNAPFTYKCPPAPEDSYGMSKLMAENRLRELAAETDMEVVIIRPPLVYGPGVKANFASIMKIVSKNIPLPLGSINNRRSMVALDNLVSLIVTCIDHPNAANQTFLVSDDQDVSTTELLRKMAHAFGKRTILIPIPMSWIRFVAIIFGKKMVVDRLCNSLQVDISHTKATLGWKPPVTMEQQLSSIASSMSSLRDI